MANRSYPDGPAIGEITKVGSGPWMIRIPTVDHTGTYTVPISNEMLEAIEAFARGVPKYVPPEMPDLADKGK